MEVGLGHRRHPHGEAFWRLEKCLGEDLNGGLGMELRRKCGMIDRWIPTSITFKPVSPINPSILMTRSMSSGLQILEGGT